MRINLRLPTGDFHDVHYGRTPSKLVRGLTKSRPATYASDAGSVTVWWQDDAWHVDWCRRLVTRGHFVLPSKRSVLIHLRDGWEWLHCYSAPFVVPATTAPHEGQGGK